MTSCSLKMRPSPMKRLLRPALFVLLLPCLFVYSQPCSLSYSQNNFKLVGHTIRTVSSSSSDQCLSHCTPQPNCSSINYEQHGKICELNNANHVSHPESLTSGSGWLYVNYIGRPPPYCSDSLCSGTDVCLLDYDGENYECSECKGALGMEDGRIPDSSITASKNDSIYSGNYGRLKSKNWTIENGGEHFHIDLGKVLIITQIATQGCDWGTKRGHVGKYELQHSKDNATWIEYVFNGTSRLRANTDESSVVTNSFHPKIKARYVRITPVQWDEQISLRVELYGCSIP